jgi:membrane protein YdbS with pleckstrin-like domain
MPAGQELRADIGLGSYCAARVPRCPKGVRSVPACKGKREYCRFMSYIDSNLLAGEKVVYRTRLHWLLFMAPVLFTAAVLLPIAWFLANGTWSSFAWIPLALAVLVLLATSIKRQSSDFAVTNKRVMMKVGVFSTRSVELLLSKIEAIAVNQSFIGRIFGYGDIVVTGSGGTREAFSHIQGPLEFRRAVQSVTDTQSRSPQTTAPLAGRGAAPE